MRLTGSIILNGRQKHIKALQTGQPLRVLSDEIASKTADELESYPGQSDSHFNELKAILDDEKSDYKTRLMPDHFGSSRNG